MYHQPVVVYMSPFAPAAANWAVALTFLIHPYGFMVASPSFLALFSNIPRLASYASTHPSPRTSGASEPEGHLLDYTVAQAVSSSSETASANTPFVTRVVKEEYKRNYITM